MRVEAHELTPEQRAYLSVPEQEIDEATLDLILAEIQRLERAELLRDWQ